jgi:hypothetical protein
VSRWNGRPSAFDPEDHWSPCYFPERPVDDLVIWCGTPCPACLVSVTVVLNGLDPIADHEACEYYADVIAVLSGEAS